MAAPTLASISAKRKKQILKKQPPKKAKRVLHSPFESKWPVIDTDVSESILKDMHKTFFELNLKPSKHAWDPASRGKNAGQKSKDQSNHSVWTKEQHHIRNQLVFGINAVTRHLEKNKLLLVVVDRSSEPAILTKHLVALTAVRRCPALAIPNLAKRLATHLGVTSLVALGFKKTDETIFSYLIKSIVRCVVPIELPWIRDGQEENEHLDTPSVQQITSLNTSPKIVNGKESPDLEHSDKSDIRTNEHVKSQQKSSNKRKTHHVPLEEFPFKHLYVFKKEKNFGSDFIKFSKDDSDEADTVCIQKCAPIKSKKRKYGDASKTKISYVAARVGQLISNPERSKKKKKVARYFVPKK